MRHNYRSLFTTLTARLLCLAMMLAVPSFSIPTANAAGDDEPVTVVAPPALNQRNNNELNTPAPSADKKGTPRADKKTGDDKLDELDDDGRDADRDRKSDRVTEEKRPPQRSRTTQQTIQGRTVGYRIQAYSDNNARTGKSAAQKRARDIAMKFPQYRTYISYNAPSWRLRIGDFRTAGEAQAALNRIRSVFPSYARQMTIVRDHINVWN